MKIMVLYHTAWTEMMLHSWQENGNIEIRSLPLPVADWNAKPELKRKISRLIVDLAEIEKPLFILDINGAGILPLDDDKKNWTVEKAGVPWIEWWWDDPINYYNHFTDCIEKWHASLTAENIRHFFWDKILAEEYSVWFGKKCLWLPTATHPGAFNPAAEQYSAARFAPSDISFLGTFYNTFPGENCTAWKDELEFLADQRVNFPEKNYFKIINECPEKLPLFGTEIRNAVEKSGKLFPEKLSCRRSLVNSLTEIKRRNEILEKILLHFNSFFFAGDNWPEKFKASGKKIYRPEDLTARYLNSFINLDLGNGQSFTGTNMRSYEIMSCEALLAYIGKFPDFDPQGKLNRQIYIRASSCGELAELCSFYKRETELCREIKKNARKYIIENHTWANRLKTLLESFLSK